MRDRIFYSVCFGFIFGVLLRSFLFTDFYLVILFSLISLFLILFFSFVSKNNWALVFCCFVLAFSLGILRFHSADTPAPYILESQVGENITLSGEVVDEPHIREDNQALTIELQERDVKIKALVT